MNTYHKLTDFEQLPAHIRQRLNEMYAASPEPDVSAMAEWLVRIQAEETVRQGLRAYQLAEAQSRATYAASFYSFYPPFKLGPGEKVIEDENHRQVVVRSLGKDEAGVEILERVNPSPVRVKAPDFDAFCKANTLDPVAMRQVANGEIREHKGWRQSHEVQNGAMGVSYREPRPYSPPATKDERINVTVKRGIIAAPVPRPVEWSPAE